MDGCGGRGQGGGARIIPLFMPNMSHETRLNCCGQISQKGWRVGSGEGVREEGGRLWLRIGICNPFA